ncbi:MAG: hypothetical protein V4656_17160 [Pseudomonadota bacterium]
MSLSRSTVRTMDLAAIRLAEVEPHGRAFRHKRSIAARLAAWAGREPLPPPAPYPEPSPPLAGLRDVYAWRTVAELLGDER